MLVEDEINQWIQQTLQREQQASASPNMMARQNQVTSQMPPSNMPVENTPAKANPPPVQDLRPEDEGVLAYHGNEMGAQMSTSYSFIEEGGNSSLNSNFSFLEGASQETRINTLRNLTVKRIWRKVKSIRI